MWQAKTVFLQTVDLSIIACTIHMLPWPCESDGVDDIVAGPEPGEILLDDTKDTPSRRPKAAPSKPAGALDPQHAEHMATILGTIPALPHAPDTSLTPVPRQAQGNTAEGLVTGQQPNAAVQHLPADAMLEDAATSGMTADGGSSPSAAATAAELVYGLKWAVPVAVSFMAHDLRA